MRYNKDNHYESLEGRVFLAKVIAVANQKGGVGKTTTTVNVCAGLAQAGFRVLLLDIDPQGNATGGLGIDRSKLSNSIYEVLTGTAVATQTIVPTNVENLSLLPSNIHLAGAEVDLVSVSAREFVLQRALSPIQAQYDYILMDCPPSLGLLTINALTAANSVLVPIQCEYYALEGLSQLMNTVRLIKKHLNTALQVEGIVLTMFDSRTNLSAMVVDEVKKYFGTKVYNALIPRSVRLAEAPSFGMSIFQYDAKSAGALAYEKLAAEIISENGGLSA